MHKSQLTMHPPRLLAQNGHLTDTLAMAHGNSARDAIVLDSDSDDELAVITAAAAARKSGTKTSAAPAPAATASSAVLVVAIDDESPPPVKTAGTPSASGPALAMSRDERLALERARQERNRKRRREQGLTSEDEDEARAKAGFKLDDSSRIRTSASASAGPSSSRSAVQPSKFVDASTLFESANIMGASTSSVSPSSSSSDPVYRRIQPDERFWHGALRHTASTSAPAAKRGVPFSDVLLPATASNPSGLIQGIVSTFSMDAQWFFPHFPRGTSRSEGGSAPDLLLLPCMKNAVSKSSTPSIEI